MSADPVELLDRLAPPEGWSERTDLDADPVAADILQRVFDGNVVSLDAARRRRRRGIGGAVVVAAVVAGGAVAALLGRDAEEARALTCWKEAVNPPAEQSAVAWNGVDEPVDVCLEEWAAGRFSMFPPPAPLRACVDDNGVVVVVPGEFGTCDDLGFAEFSLNVDEEALAVARVTVELDERFNPQTCRSTDDAEEETATVLEHFGLSGWTVVVAGTSSADEPCAVVSLIPQEAEAVITTIPRPD